MPLPFIKGSDTSEQSAQDAQANSDAVRRMIYDFIRTYPGQYSDEGVLITLGGRTGDRDHPSTAGTWRRARIELEDHGLVERAPNKVVNVSRSKAYAWRTTNKDYPDPWPATPRSKKLKAPQALYDALEHINCVVFSGEEPPHPQARLLLEWLKGQLDQGKGPALPEPEYFNTDDL